MTWLFRYERANEIRSLGLSSTRSTSKFRYAPERSPLSELNREVVHSKSSEDTLIQIARRISGSGSFLAAFNHFSILDHRRDLLLPAQQPGERLGGGNLVLLRMAM